MKIFIYKTLIVMLFVYLVFEFTIGKRLDKFERQIEILQSKEERNRTIDKIRKEIKSANSREYILLEEDRILISDFFKKLRKELSLE
tara:strand:+ start:8342 stop:8602 length:261 start_codon:yes stop_codon:yes gene_type:complete